MATEALRLPNIHCDGCVRTIVSALMAVPGVDSVDGDPAQKVIRVRYHSGTLSLETITRTLADIGFPVEGIPYRPATWRNWVLALLAIAGAAALGWLGYRLGFWRFVTSIAMPQGFEQYNLWLVAAGAGIAAFFSPCIFPLLPAYVTYDLGLLAGTRNRLLRSLVLGGAAGVGVIAVNLAIGAVIAALGQAAPFQPDPRKDPAAILLIRTLAGVAVVGLGVITLTGRSLAAGLLAKLVPAPQVTTTGLRSMFWYGFLYNAAGIGCTGPILLSVVLFALTAGSAASAFATFGVFSLTMGALMVSVTVLAGLSQAMLIQRLRLATPFLHRLGGAAMIFVGGYTAISLATGPGRELFVRIFLSFLR